QALAPQCLVISASCCPPRFRGGVEEPGFRCPRTPALNLNWKAQTMKTQDQTEGFKHAAGSNSADAGEIKGREYAQNAPGAPAKPPKLNAGTLAAGEASKRPEGLLSLPPDLRAFLRSRSVSEIAEVLRLGKGTASRI